MAAYLSNVADDLLKKIKANQPEILTKDNDFLGTISKGDMIKGFLDSLLERPIEKDENGEIIPDIQMIALYGEWGSGKTSLMKYIQEQLKKEPKNFSTVFFEAWKLENDENLALSLLDSISKENKGNVGIYKDKIWNSLKKITRSTISGIRTPLFDVGKAFDTGKQAFENKSFNDAVKAFEDSYVELETAVLNNIDGANRKLIVFIDDLDRCAPENVLSLLSAIKLFFTFGQKTIFICGLDEKAVDEAVKVKYGNVIKSGEYMEKIFDISFDMPKPNINKMIGYYFADMPNMVKGVQEFFEAMHFTNPRHIKKVLNKYLLLRYYKETGLDVNKLIPDQDIEFFRYLTLFIIILYKFEPDDFEIIKNYDEKLAYLKNHGETIEPINSTSSVSFHVDFNFFNRCSFEYIFPQEENEYSGSSGDFIGCYFALMFGSRIDGYKKYSDNILSAEYINQFIIPDTKSGYFIKYLEDCQYTNYLFERKNGEISGQFTIHLTEIGRKLEDSRYVIWHIFDMAERYL